MNLALTDDQTMIRDAAETFLGDVSDSAAVRAAMASAEGFDAEVWKRIRCELGWCGLSIDEAHGGLGLGAVELALVLEQAGRRLLCAPFFSTVCLAANLLQHCGSATAQTRLLPTIADGSVQATAPLPSVPDWSSAARDLTARSIDEGWILHGRCERVPDATSADVLLLFAKIDGGDAVPALFAIPSTADGLTITPLETWDATRRFATLELDGVSLRREDRIDEPSRIEDGLIRAAALARLYLAAEALGCAQQCLDLTIAYTATRRQFGRTIASFQAVKHRCAEMMVRLEATRSAVAGAAAFAADASDATALSNECAMARVLASDTLFFSAQEAIQLHGGVGFTWEYDPQLYFKRAQAGSHWLGTADALREDLAASLFA